MPRRNYQPLPSPTERPTVLNSDDESNNSADDESIFEASTATVDTFHPFTNLNSGAESASAAVVSTGAHAAPGHSVATGANQQDDEDILNPYDAALLPPSVELSNLQTSYDRIMDPLERRHVHPQVGSCALFDPYSSEAECIHGNRGLNPGSVKRRGSSYDTRNTIVNRDSWRNDLLEMEEEEIDFFSESADNIGSIIGNSCTSTVNHGLGSIHGRNDRVCEFGESSPLSSGVSQSRYSGGSGGSFFERTRQHDANMKSGTPLLQRLMHGVQLLWNSVSSTSTQTRHTNNPFAHRHTQHSENAFTTFLAGSRKRMKFSHFRRLIVATSILLMICTLGTVRRVLFNTAATTNVSSGSTEDNTNYLQYSKRPDSLVLNKMAKAKRRWWTKNHEGETNNVEVYREGVVESDADQQQMITNVEYAEQQKTSQEVDVNQQQALESDAHQVVDSAIHIISNASHQILDNVQVPVIVQTGEDGSLLIKLPPPNMGRGQSTNRGQQQKKEEEEQPTSGSSNVINSNLDPLQASTETTARDDDTVYIKLPYESQQRRALSDAIKQEVDPPLRGAAIHDHPNLKRRPPAPFELHNANSNNARHTSHKSHLSIHAHQEHHPGVLDTLRSEFSSWMKKHGKKYGSSDEQERRFHTWKRNHFRISEKNERHGPCKLTGKAVFGHNLFSDLDPEEFQDRYLTGYRGPRIDDSEGRPYSADKNVGKRFKLEEMEPPYSAMTVHPTIQRKLEEQNSSVNRAKNLDDYKSKYYQYKKKFANDCDWWDVSCMLRWIFGYQYIGGTREPVYDESTYPDALDWRNMGVVSSVHAQGSCGACWAITAVETIESAYAIKTGELLDLAEEEVIACDGTCEMCNGGWPQNAYKYVMKHDGLPVKNAEYDADFLYYLTATLTGESETVSENDMTSYFAQTCPAGVREGGGGGGSGSGSRDEDNGSSNGSARYGQIKGYGYATERCVCYTDGSGCDCDDQDEQKAVLNIASYGPAAVCLEASLWQSYEGGIMTSDTGCGSAFLDMNHCVQVVGYAFTTSSADIEGGGGSADQRSGSRDGGGSRDDGGKREGYWIVKNQWSTYWGMNGYAYLAMGDNTCGILNDMTQVYQ